MLSAKTPEALEGRRRLLADDLASHPQVDLADAAYTLAVGRVAHALSRGRRRRRHGRRPSGCCGSPTAQATVTRTSAATGAEVAFLFTGQGAQYVGMGAGLYRSEPVFAEAMQACALILGGIDGHDLIDLLYGEHEDTAAADQRLLRTAVGQPAIFALQYALARLWASWGVEPAAMVGHSVGELAAACIGGVFTLEDALRLAAARGRLMQDLPIGAMTAVLARRGGCRRHCWMRRRRSPRSTHPSSAWPRVRRHRSTRWSAGSPRLTSPSVACPPIGPFHSPMMEPALDPLRDHVDGTSAATCASPWSAR